MGHIARAEAEGILANAGWLPLQPEPLRSEILRLAVLRHAGPGEPLFHLGDPPGGIYGLASGTVTISIAAEGATPRLIMLGVPGYWTGEGCFLTRMPRRGEVRAVVDSTLLHLPLDAMDRIAARDPSMATAVAQILMMSVEFLLRVIHDLQKRDVDRRIAAVIVRTAWIGDVAIPVAQTDLAMMANASRRQVLNALKRFAASGWVETAYRSITVRDIDALRTFAEQEDDDLATLAAATRESRFLPPG